MKHTDFTVEHDSGTHTKSMDSIQSLIWYFHSHAGARGPKKSVVNNKASGTNRSPQHALAQTFRDEAVEAPEAACCIACSKLMPI